MRRLRKSFSRVAAHDGWRITVLRDMAESFAGESLQGAWR